MKAQLLSTRRPKAIERPTKQYKRCWIYEMKWKAHYTDKGDGKRAEQHSQMLLRPYFFN